MSRKNDTGRGHGLDIIYTITCTYYLYHNMYILSIP